MTTEPNACPVCLTADDVRERHGEYICRRCGLQAPIGTWKKLSAKRSAVPSARYLATVLDALPWANDVNVQTAFDTLEKAITKANVTFPLDEHSSVLPRPKGACRCFLNDAGLCTSCGQVRDAEPRGRKGESYCQIHNVNYKYMCIVCSREEAAVSGDKGGNS